MAGRSCAVKELGNKPGTKNFVVMRKQSDLLAGLSREQYVSEQVSLEGFSSFGRQLAAVIAMDGQDV